MRLTIRSLFEAVLDMDSVRVLFVRSQPVAVVRMHNENEKWEAYQINVANKETAEMIKCWFDDYISTVSDLRVLAMESLMELIKKCE